MNGHPGFKKVTLIVVPLIFFSSPAFSGTSCESLLNPSAMGIESMILNDGAISLYDWAQEYVFGLTQKGALASAKPVKPRVSLTAAKQMGFVSPGRGLEGLVADLKASLNGKGGDAAPEIVGQIVYSYLVGLKLDYSTDLILEGGNRRPHSLPVLKDDGSAVTSGTPFDFFRRSGPPAQEYGTLLSKYMSAHDDRAVLMAKNAYTGAVDTYLRPGGNGNRQYNEAKEAYQNFARVLRSTRIKIMGERDFTAFENQDALSLPSNWEVHVPGTAPIDSQIIKRTPLLKNANFWEEMPETISKKDLNLEPYLWHLFSRYVSYGDRMTLIKELMQDPEVFYAFYIKEFKITTNRTVLAEIKKIVSQKDEGIQFGYKVLAQYLNAVLAQGPIPYASKHFAQQMLTQFLNSKQITDPSDSNMNPRRTSGLDADLIKLIQSMQKEALRGW